MNTIVCSGVRGQCMSRGVFLISTFFLFLKELFIFCQHHFHFLFKSPWKNSLRNNPLSGCFYSAISLSGGSCRTVFSAGSCFRLQQETAGYTGHLCPFRPTGGIPQVEQQFTQELKQSIHLEFSPWSHFPAVAFSSFSTSSISQ